MLQSKKGFTLVELIVVITILAILGTIAFISLQGYSKDARNSTRISDTANINKTLELYQLKKSKYPMPDSPQAVTYNSDTLRLQGNFGETVSQDLGKLISEAPVDPLYGLNYVYSVTVNRKEYEILTAYEGNDLVSTSLLQEVSANNGYVPKLSGNYNGVFVKGEHYIVPTPSIINALISDSTDGLNLVSLDSQVVTGEKNIPALGDEIAGSGSLTGLTLTGVLLSGSLENDKDQIMDAIDTTYNSSTITDIQEIAYVLNGINNGEKDIIFDLVIAGKKSSSASVISLCEEGYTYNVQEKLCQSEPICDSDYTFDTMLQVCKKEEIGPAPKLMCSGKNTTGTNKLSCTANPGSYCTLDPILPWVGSYSRNATFGFHDDCSTRLIIINEWNNGRYGMLEVNGGYARMFYDKGVYPPGTSLFYYYSFVNTSSTTSVCGTGYIKTGSTCTRELQSNPTCLGSGIINETTNKCETDKK